MEIVIAAQGMPFGPNTLDQHSLGGSETAAMMMAKELRALGHLVTMFCNLPPAGRDDFIHSGSQDDDGVRWVNIEQFAPFVANTEVDLLVVSRNPDLFNTVHQAKKAVLWCHDLATYQHFMPALMQVAWNFNEIWCVSEYHRQQIHQVTGYPLDNIRATRNGIVRFDSLLNVDKEPKSMLYSARPERGLIHLVCEGGIMERLHKVDPEFKLRVTMYENYPPQLMDFYRYLWARCEALPNVELLGATTQRQLRQLMKKTWLYVYPTEFEEVSCIIARECMEQQVPFLTTKVGALPETLGNTGWYMNETTDHPDFVDDFADAIMYLHKCPEVMEQLAKFCSERTDLYWEDVAVEWESWAYPETPSTYSLVKSLLEDSDVLAADAVLVNSMHEVSPGLDWLRKEMEKYDFIQTPAMTEAHYQRIYELEDSKGVPERQELRTLKGTARYNEIANLVAHLPANARVLEYGCAEGPIILQLAQDFPGLHFTGVDFVAANVALCIKFAQENKITNVNFLLCDLAQDSLPDDTPEYDAAIIAEVLEHVKKPWEVSDYVEAYVKPGGKMIITVPQGPWEMRGLRNLQQWNWRAHVWHIDKWMLRTMFEEKEGCLLSNLAEGLHNDGRSVGHLVMSFDADHKEAKSISPTEKAQRHRCRQTIAACMIAMNDDDVIIRCLNSIEPYIDILQVALGPSDDHTFDRLREWAAEHPWIDFRLVRVPKIKAGVFGFDDARNASTQDIEADWILWIDSDEYLSGQSMRVFCRSNCFDSYAIHQHHFTCDPRGVPTQLDKPARLYRNNHVFEFFGKVHEHAELGFNGGPGFVMVLPDVDIGHTGYVNENVRRERFGRNFPLLEWDQQVYPKRKMGIYLWLRDIIHRMRVFAASGQQDQARLLAEEAVSYYELNTECLGSIGGGNVAGNNALAYYSEALQFLGRGFPISVQVGIDGQEASYSGFFTTAEQAFELGKKALAEEIRKRESGYWG